MLVTRRGFSLSNTLSTSCIAAPFQFHLLAGLFARQKKSRRSILVRFTAPIVTHDAIAGPQHGSTRAQAPPLPPRLTPARLYVEPVLQHSAFVSVSLLA